MGEAKYLSIFERFLPKDTAVISSSVFKTYHIYQHESLSSTSIINHYVSNI